jgi:hypothetical protein
MKKKLEKESRNTSSRDVKVNKAALSVHMP